MHDDARDKPSLPAGWVWTTIGEACEVILGQSPPSSTYNTKGIGLPFYQGKAEFGALYPTPIKWCSKPKKFAKAGDILISVRAPVGPTNLCREKSCIGRGLSAIRSRNGISNFFVFYFLRSIEQDWESKATGTTFSAISGKTLREQAMPLPPLSQQRRIVAEIETQFTRLGAAVAALERAQANLGRYRASVLKPAYKGRLVPNEAVLARAEGRAYEPADVLLARILAKRRRHQYKAPEPPDTEELDALPEGWMWTTLGQLLERIDAGRSPKAQNRPAQGNESGVLKVSAVSWGKFLPEENKALFPCDEIGETPRPRAGDLLISRANTVELVGAVVLVDQDHPRLMLSDKTLRLVPASDDILNKYLLYALKTPAVRKFFASQATGTSDSMRNLSQAKFRATPIPLPPLPEQRRIVAEVERRLSLVEAMETAVASNLRRAERLRQSILKRAFEGRFAPQDPDDEPAAALLARVQAEREQADSQGKRQREQKHLPGI